MSGGVCACQAMKVFLERGMMKNGAVGLLYVFGLVGKRCVSVHIGPPC